MAGAQPRQDPTPLPHDCRAAWRAQCLPAAAHRRRQDAPGRAYRRRGRPPLPRTRLPRGAVDGADQHHPRADCRGAEEARPPLPRRARRGLRRACVGVRRRRDCPNPAARPDRARHGHRHHDSEPTHQQHRRAQGLRSLGELRAALRPYPRRHARPGARRRRQPEVFLRQPHGLSPPAGHRGRGAQGGHEPVV